MDARDAIGFADDRHVLRSMASPSISSCEALLSFDKKPASVECSNAVQLFKASSQTHSNRVLASERLAFILCTSRLASRINRYRCVLGPAQRSEVETRTDLPELRRHRIPRRTVGPDTVVFLTPRSAATSTSSQPESCKVEARSRRQSLAPRSR